MLDRTALTAAVTNGAPEPASPPARDDLVFGKVAGPGADGPGARAQDVELFDVTRTLPRVPGEAGTHGRHGAGKPRHVRKESRSRRAARAPEREGRSGLSLPLLLTGALAAGIGLAVGLTPESGPTPPNGLSLVMPDLPAPHVTPDAEPPATGRTSQPTAAPTTVSTTASPPPTAPAPPPSAPTPPPTRTHRPTPSPTPVRSSPRSDPPGASALALALGSTGPEVVDLQGRLQQLYLYLGPADGVFGESLEVALSRFQVARAVPEEPGVYGPMTRAALYAETHRPGRKGRNGSDDGDDRGGWGGWDG
ncbi:peptidoglycan-binding protein [Streptomyces sp. NPDC004520]|uniref:peptidoglycan-binding domain-containing protein n=1 Tax=Streptomyces sp. NPDC004520 TaxID=3364702 RepID=UPI0036CBE95D